MDTAVNLDRSRFDNALATTRRHYKLPIDADWREAVDGGVLTRVSPARDTLVSTYARAGTAEVEAAIGRELGRNAVVDDTEEKTLHRHAGPRKSWWLPAHPNGAA
jgi:hypothetical protein